MALWAAIKKKKIFFFFFFLSISDTAGNGDYAILIMVTDRRCEVARLQLDYLDWRPRVGVRGKASR